MYPLGCAAVSAALGHRIRWAALATLTLGWFVGLAANVGGNALNLLLVAAIGLLVYELLVVETPS